MSLALGLIFTMKSASSLISVSASGQPGRDLDPSRLEYATQPTVCALDGVAYGGGADLALACDFRVGVLGMNASMPAARLGVM